MTKPVWDGARERIYMCEVGTRDGLQIEAAFVPTEDKIELVNALSEAGLAKIGRTERRVFASFNGRVSCHLKPACAVAINASTASVTKIARQPKNSPIRAPAIGPSAGTNASIELRRP